MTENDPNYISRLNNQENVRLTKKQFLMKLLLAPVLNLKTFFIGPQDTYSRDLKFIKSNRSHWFFLISNKLDNELSKDRYITLAVSVILLSIVVILGLTLQFFLYWIVPLYITFPIILKFVDLTEHNWWDESCDLKKNTNTIEPGFLHKNFVSDLNRHYHYEHHLYPQVPFYKLPRVKYEL
jgi:fatty acid desaturase